MITDIKDQMHQAGCCYNVPGLLSELDTMHVHQATECPETVSVNLEQRADLRYGRPLTHSTPGTSLHDATRPREQINSRLGLGDVSQDEIGVIGETEHALVGNFFDPSTWLPDSFPVHLVATSPLMHAPNTLNQNSSPAYHDIGGLPSMHQPTAHDIPSQVDGVVDWPLVLAFLHLYHERL